MFAGKPIIGLVGGIGSGKSYIADIFGQLGCLVIHSDKLVEQAYNNPDVTSVLEKWWGNAVLRSDGKINRKAVADVVFSDPAQRIKLEAFLHPMVNQMRIDMMNAATDDHQILAFVWDTPLLMETGLNKQCDAIVFVNAPADVRRARVSDFRRWNPDELTRRENLQLPLDKKQKISEYVIDNTADADYARGQVKDVLFRIRGQSS